MIQVEGLVIDFDRFTLQLQAVTMPLPFQHLRQAKDHHIQKAAY